MKKLVIIISVLSLIFIFYGCIRYDGEQIINNQQIGKLKDITREENFETELIIEEQENIIEKNEQTENDKNIAEVKEDTVKIDTTNNTSITEQKEITKTETIANIKKPDNSEKIVTEIKDNLVKTEKTEEIIKTEEKKDTKTVENKKVDKEIQKEENKSETIEKVITPKKSNCENGQHIVTAGNSNKWFNTQAEAVKFYDNEIKKWSNMLENKEIQFDEYYKKCPSGYEVWSCPYCEKWTINMY